MVDLEDYRLFLQEEAERLAAQHALFLKRAEELEKKRQFALKRISSIERRLNEIRAEMEKTNG